MKKVLFLLAFSSNFSPSNAQVSFSPNWSTSYDKGANPIGLAKKPIGATISYDFSQNVGIGLHFQNCYRLPYNEKVDQEVAMRSLALEFYLWQSPEKQTGWFFYPLAGVSVGMGKTIGASTAERVNRQLLANPYFAGLSLQANVGRHFGKRFDISLFARTEALIVMIADRPWGIQSNVSSAAIFSCGSRITLGKKKIAEKF